MICAKVRRIFSTVLSISEKLPQRRAVLGRHSGELYSIAHLWIAGNDQAFGVQLYALDPQTNFQLGSHLQRKHHLYVAPDGTEVCGFDTKRRCRSCRMQLCLDRQLFSLIMPALETLDLRFLVGICRNHDLIPCLLPELRSGTA